MIPINTTMNNNHVFIGEALTSIDELKRHLEKKFNSLVISLQKFLKQQKRDAREITDCLRGKPLMEKINVCFVKNESN